MTTGASVLTPPVRETAAALSEFLPFSLRRSHTLNRPALLGAQRPGFIIEAAMARTPFDSPALFYEASHLTASLFLGEERRRRGGKCSRTESCQCSISVAAWLGRVAASRGDTRCFSSSFSFLHHSLPDWRTLGVTGHFEQITSVLDWTASVKRAQTRTWYSWLF